MKSTLALSTVLSLWASFRSLAMALWFSLTSLVLFFCSLNSLARWSRSRRSISNPPSPRSNLRSDRDKDRTEPGWSFQRGFENVTCWFKNKEEILSVTETPPDHKPKLLKNSCVRSHYTFSVNLWSHCKTLEHNVRAGLFPHRSHGGKSRS